MTPVLPQVGRTVDAVRQGLHRWLGEVCAAAGAPLPVSGAVPASGGPTLVALPYQILLESNASASTLPLVPVLHEPANDGVPALWRRMGIAATRIVVESYPSRAASGPAPIALDPAPEVARLPGPVAAWYRRQGAPWVTTGAGEPLAVLPTVEWHSPIALAIRFALLVPAVDARPDHDAVQLRALAACAAAVRLDRHFPIREETALPPGPLRELLEALSAVDHAEAPTLREAVTSLTRPRELAVGVAPHQDLNDHDLALVMQALRQPMQPTVVFSVRVGLGAGPVLVPGVTPSVPSVEKRA
jgi:hypothetical protein